MKSKDDNELIGIIYKYRNNRIQEISGLNPLAFYRQLD